MDQGVGASVDQQAGIAATQGDRCGNDVVSASGRGVRGGVVSEVQRQPGRCASCRDGGIDVDVAAFNAAMEKLRADSSIIASAVEELLRYESPSQHTARLAPEDLEMGGKQIRKRQAVIAVMGAANRDPERFPDPDHLDLKRKDNRHVAFGWAAHFCFGAPLARIEGQIAFQTLLHRFPNLDLEPNKPVIWRHNLGLRGLTALHVTF